MNQQPDKLFREKLEHYSRPAPSSAWSKIEQRLDKKNSKGIWLKVAAAVVVLAVATVWLLKNDQATKPLPITEKKIEPVAPAIREGNDLPATSALTPETAEQNPAVVKQYVTRNEVKKSTQKKITVKQKLQPARHSEKGNHTPSIEHAQKNIIERGMTSSSDKGSTLADHSAPVNNKNITLIYSAEEVNEKYLDKKALAEATSGDKKSSTLRKLLDKAYDLKYNQEPFGDLRQKKNEILALNFKNEKQRTENK